MQFAVKLADVLAVHVAHDAVRRELSPKFDVSGVLIGH